ncbi:MAG: hypothetical protein WC402_03460 [Candidatus Pacearchaeota archaeon]|jgi:hypothetical protein
MPLANCNAIMGGGKFRKESVGSCKSNIWADCLNRKFYKDKIIG